MSSLSKVVISQPKPMRTLVWAVLIISLVVTAQWFYNQEHNKTVIVQLEETSKELEQLQNNYNALTQQYSDIDSLKASLQQKLKQQRDSDAIQKVTDQQLTKQLSELQSEVMALKKELLFYQNITQGTSSSKLQVREFFIYKTEVANKYLYRVVITQGKKVSKPITGKIKLTLTNTDSDKAIDLTGHSLNLRHIQVVEGTITTSGDSQPKSINVTVTQGKKTTANKTFDWKITAP